MSAQRAPASAPLGVVILCHTALHRVAAVVRFWLAASCPVVLHVDRAVPEADLQALRAELGAQPLLRFGPRHRCDWGSWGLVAATQDSAALLLDDFPDVTHVLLTSGSCLPLRPVAEMLATLQARPRVDFIESVPVAHGEWILGGLGEERFTLYFPFNWRRQRWLFDRAVELQRRLRVARRVPRPLVPHLGAQWWCLTRATLGAILKDPARPHYERYFRRTWIPDEAYFQTLARLHAAEIESRSLTLVKFDRNGRPNLFYDDHLHLLRRSECFMARKIWPEAAQLYDFFLNNRAAKLDPVPPEPARIDRYFELAAAQRRDGRAGLYMQSRFPREDASRVKSAGPYSVFWGFDQIFADFDYWLGQVSGLRVHGHLYAPERVQFHGGAKVWHGALSDAAAIRDYHPRMFLTNLLWATRGERQCFSYGPSDHMDHELDWFMATDMNARLSMITGAFALSIFRSGQTGPELIARLTEAHKREQEFLAILRSRWAVAEIRIHGLAEALGAPQQVLGGAIEGVADAPARAIHGWPALRSLDGFDAFVAGLSKQGLPPQLRKDLTL